MKQQQQQKRKRKGRRPGLQTIRPQGAGIDLGSREHWVCGPSREDGEPNVRTFGTTTGQLRELADWLDAEGVESVAMESTYVYWVPLHELLEERGFEVLLVNARQLKNVPGRKTDMNDCQWIQQLHACGLLRGSFRPHEAVTRLRSLHRQMQNLVAQRSRFVQWMQQALDQMNVQVHRAVSDLTGQTAAYEQKLQEELEQQDDQALPDEDCPAHPNPAKEKAIRARGEQTVRTTLYRYAGVDLTRIDGISAGAARTIITEIGPDLAAFPTEKHFVSWMGLAPRHAVSGGKPLPGKQRGRGMGATRVSNALRMAATSLIRSTSALGAALRRKARHKGMKTAIFATARKLATLVYRMLYWGQDYVDVGEAAYEERYRQRTLAHLKTTAKDLGYQLVPDTAFPTIRGPISAPTA